MPDQVEYYNRFGESYRDDILTCPEPQFWTTDYGSRGRVYTEMVQRVGEQTALVQEFFINTIPVLDIGCGFGRQAIVLAKNGFNVTGVDTSKIFIEIATELFKRNHLPAKFSNSSLNDLPPGKFSQIILFDVIEHIKPSARSTFLNKVHSLSPPGTLLIVSLPHLRKRLTSRLNNSLRKRITQHFSYFMSREEHPFPIPTTQRLKKLIDGLFTIVKFRQTSFTDYFVLRKI
jgi:2-polyprenyl-3-methyl-5-hydroxy-6-metoxy-1,4-benzoquinol methylase